MEPTAIRDSERGDRGDVAAHLELNLTPENNTRMMEDGVVFSATVPFKGRARHVKAVVYEYSTDRLGTALTEVRR